MAGSTIDIDRLQAALDLIEGGELDQAVTLLAPLVRGKRHTRPSRINAEPLEVDEVKDWLRRAIADPAGDDARYYLDRAYYKLRTLRPIQGNAPGRPGHR